MSREFYGSAHGIILDVFSRTKHDDYWRPFIPDISSYARIIENTYLSRWQVGIHIARVQHDITHLIFASYVPTVKSTDSLM